MGRGVTEPSRSFGSLKARSSSFIKRAALKLCKPLLEKAREQDEKDDDGWRAWERVVLDNLEIVNDNNNNKPDSP